MSRTMNVAVACAVAASAGLLASSARAGGLIASTWDCANGDVLTFELPAVAGSPGAGALVAPYPGFLTAVEGPVAEPLGTYIVLAYAGSPSGPFTPVGQKNGLAGSTLVCTLAGTPVTVVVAPAGR